MKSQNIDRILSYGLIVSLVLLLIYQNYQGSINLKYDSVEDCILKNIGKSDGDQAARLIYRACRNIIDKADSSQGDVDIIDPFEDLIPKN